MYLIKYSEKVSREKYNTGPLSPIKALEAIKNTHRGGRNKKENKNKNKKTTKKNKKKTRKIRAKQGKTKNKSKNKFKRK